MSDDQEKPKDDVRLNPSFLAKVRERADEIQAPWLGDAGRRWQQTEATVLAWLELTSKEGHHA